VKLKEFCNSLKVDQDGNLIYSYVYDEPNQYGKCIILNRDGDYTVAGGHEGGQSIAELICIEGPGTGFVEQGPEQTPFDLHLISSFPNPFNPSVKIHFELNAPSLVKLTIWNTAGELIACLANGRYQTGIHEFSFNGKDLTSGIYLARLEAGDQEAITKMILLR
jgi:hypothetical protein